MEYTKDDFYKAIISSAMTKGYQGDDVDENISGMAVDLSSVILVESHPHIYDRLVEDYLEDLMYIKQWGV